MPELMLDVLDSSNGRTLGWVVVDSSVNDRSHGGLRISQSVSKEELTILAHRMTLKFGFLGIANGGAKAGIVGDPEASVETRHDLLKKFAASIEQLVKTGRYLPHADMGTTETEIREIFGITALPGEPTRDESGFYTSTGVALAARVAIQALGKQLSGMSVAVEGFGKVGSGVAKLLNEFGAKIVAVSTSKGALYQPDGLNVDQLLAAWRKWGSEFVKHYENAKILPRDELFFLNVDVLCPCANSRSIHLDNAQQVQAKLICPGANAPITPEAEPQLIARGIRVLPDYVTNSGGVLGGTMAFAGIPKNKIRPMMYEVLEPAFRSVFSLSSADAERYCMERFQRAKIAAESTGIKQRLFQTGLRLYRSGVIPDFIVGKLASRYFRVRALS